MGSHTMHTYKGRITIGITLALSNEPLCIMLRIPLLRLMDNRLRIGMHVVLEHDDVLTSVCVYIERCDNP